MVFVNSDSNKTLVSLDPHPNDAKFAHLEGSSIVCHYHREFARSELWVEEDTGRQYFRSKCWSKIDDDDAFVSSNTKHLPLYLPQDGQRLDEHLQNISTIRSSSEELLRNEPRCFSSSDNCRERLLYVAQGERASATPRHCDVLVSDKATTCHILAFRSSSSNSKDSDDTMTSLTHLDSTSYEECVRSMIQEHVLHHSSTEEKKSEEGDAVTLEIHVMGGFNDKDSTSSGITDWLVNLLSDIAWEYNQEQCWFASTSTLRMILKTCAVTCMNDTGYSCPVGRGMGINLHTGQVFLAKCEDNIVGPVPLLRSVRLWTRSKDHKPCLSVVHSASSTSAGKLVVQPFNFAPFAEIPSLLALPDDVLLQITSTSPDVEEDGFCDSVRASMKFLLQYQCRTVFGRNVDQPLVFCRTSRNTWKQVSFD